MSKKSIIEREKKRYIMHKKYKKIRKEIKKKIKNSKNIKEYIENKIKIQMLPLNSSIIRRRKRCILTGRPRGYIGFFKMCRMKVREKIMKCEIFGITKSSW